MTLRVGGRGCIWWASEKKNPKSTYSSEHICSVFVRRSMSSERDSAPNGGSDRRGGEVAMLQGKKAKKELPKDATELLLDSVLSASAAELRACMPP